MCPDAKLRNTFGAERGVSASRISASVDFADNIDAIVEAVNSRNAVKQHIILRKVFKRDRQNTDSEISENIKTRIFTRAPAESFLH